MGPNAQYYQRHRKKRPELYNCYALWTCYIWSDGRQFPTLSSCAHALANKRASQPAPLGALVINGFPWSRSIPGDLSYCKMRQDNKVIIRKGLLYHADVFPQLDAMGLLRTYTKIFSFNSLLTGTSIKFVNDLCPWILQCQSVMMVWWLIAVSVLDSLWLCDAIWQQIYININSGNGLLSDGIKPSPESMLTYHQRCFVTFTWEQFH